MIVVLLPSSFLSSVHAVSMGTACHDNASCTPEGMETSTLCADTSLRGDSTLSGVDIACDGSCASP